jgi:Alpha/beta hydrolase domain
MGSDGEGELAVMGTVPRRCLAAGLLLLAAACSGSTSSNEAEQSPTRRARPPVVVSGPVQGGAGQANTAALDLASFGYAESEYFFGGTATGYVGEHKVDGVWDAREHETAEFRSRMIVRRPQDAARFSGTVVVEWLNVTIGRDTDPSWGYSAAEIVREGHAWVGVSAQETGVRALAGTDPQRYGSLDHPGDRYSFDIFTNAGRALARHDGAAPLGHLEPTTLVAVGLSQSASFIIAYLDGVQTLTGMFDGFLVHSPAQPSPIRDDLDQPTLVFITETELTRFGYAAARQPDSDSVRTWEVAGAAHADAWLLDQTGGGYAVSCPGHLNDGPHRQVLRAALHELVDWAKTGETPPVASPIELATKPGNGRLAVIARDERGNALGGIRTPYVDVPVSSLSGEPVPGAPPVCQSFGSTTPFDGATLARLYPNHDSYVEAFTASAEAAVGAGFILRPEADEMIAAAQQSAIGTASPW